MLKNLSSTASLKKGVSNTPKEPNYIDIIKAASSITSNMKACFTKSRWDIQKNTHSREGVSQMMSRQNYSAFLSHLRRLMLPVVKSSDVSVNCNCN
jgi:DNA-directed RNA polymerase beta subunit